MALRSLSCLIVSFYLSGSLWAQISATTADQQKVWLYPDGTWKYAVSAKQTFDLPIEWPSVLSESDVIMHSGFSLLYSEEYEQARWVAYELTAEECTGTFERTDRFKVDPKVKTKTADDQDYAKSGYDRGHLAPAADMAWSESAMAESFYFSNMSPQWPGFNRGIWKRLEEQVRNWAIEKGTLAIVTGPVLTPNLPAIGKNAVAVPDYFFKVLLDYQSTDSKMLAFLIPNTSSSADIRTFVVPVDSLENITQIDFFHQLPDNLEESLESKTCIPCWSWPTNPR